jgi:hypothetical protein
MAFVEPEFVSSFLSKISQKPVKFATDYEPESDLPAKLPAPSRPFDLKTEEEAAHHVATGTFDVTIKALKGKSFVIQVSAQDKVEQIKKIIASKEAEFPVDQQRVVFAGKGLLDERTLDEYGIKVGSTLHLMKKPVSSTTPSAQSSSANLEHAVEHLKQPEKVDPLKSDTFWKEVNTLLHKHFDKSQAEKIRTTWKKSVE